MANPAPASPPTSKFAALKALLPKTPEGRVKVITDPDEFNATIERLSDSGLCNLLGGIAYVDYIPPVQAVSMRVILSKPEYFYEASWCKDGAKALQGTALAILFREAGGSYRKTERIDDQSDRLVCQTSATVVMRTMNGLDIPITKNREIDLRPGSAERKAMVDRKTGEPQAARISQAEQTILRRCETMSQLRAMRVALSAKQSYTPKEQPLPFVIPTLVPNPDMANPQHEAFMLAHAMGVTELVYGRGRTALPAASSVVDTVHGKVDLDTGEAIEAEVVNRVVGEDLEDFAEAEPEAQACTCPCGCRAMVAAVAAAATLERRKVVRCPSCYPGRAFDELKHAKLESLGMTPDLTLAQAITMKKTAIDRAAK